MVLSVREFIEREERDRLQGQRTVRPTLKANPGPAVYFLTCAQNNTRVHAQLWRNMMALAKFMKAKPPMVSQFTYSKHRANDPKPNTENVSDYERLWYAPEIAPYVFNERIALTPSLIWCAETNTLPTADHPLTGFENYTGRASAIFPHAKQEMLSVASMERTKLLYSTGTVTLRNYVQKRAGLKAEHGHAYGFLIVEVDSDGDWFVRQVRANNQGDFYDANRNGVFFVSDGKVTGGHRAEAFQPGDVHVEQLDPTVRKVIWGDGGIIDTIKPRFQFLHDTLDMFARNHHDFKDSHRMFGKWANKQDDVQAELWRVAEFLKHESSREWCKTVVVDSNHDAAFTRWLREADYRLDPKNARYFMKAQSLLYEALDSGLTDLNLLQTLLEQMGVSGVKFLKPDESYVICKPTGGIECGLHGHYGINGAKGSPRSFARLGRPVNVGHSHSASIWGDAFTAGTCSKLRLSYNRGASSWGHSHIVVYPNGSRTIITVFNGKAWG